MANLAQSLPPPRPLRRGLFVHFQWGTQHFDAVATACSVRVVPWEETGEEITWLHCKAAQILPGQSVETRDVMNILVPAHYVTKIEVGPDFHVKRSKRGDLCIFPPNQPTPVNPVSLTDVERMIVENLDASVN